MLFAGVFLGSGLDVPGRLLVLVLVAGVGARTAALALNRIIDRRIDAANPRTAERELPRGVMSVTEARVLAITGTAVYAVAAWAIAPICLALAPIPLAVFIGYPYLKRFTPWCHLGVGLGLAMAPLGGWFAARLNFADVGPPLLLAGFTLGWVAGFDVIYATLDQVHDQAAGIRSLPVRYGRRGALAISRGIHGIAWSLLVALVVWRMNVMLALPFVLIVGALLVWEQHKAHDVDLAFFRINVWVGFAALAVVVAGLIGT